MAEQAPNFIDQIVGIMSHATEEMSKLSFHTGAPTVGAKMAEQEREIAALQSTVADLRDTVSHDAALFKAIYEAIPADVRDSCDRNGLDALVEYFARQYSNLRDEHAATRNELTQLRRTHNEFVTGQHKKQPTLSESIERMNDVIVRHLEMLSPTSGTARTVAIRRAQLAKYSIEHDVEHLADDHLADAVFALITGYEPKWPWDTEAFHQEEANGTQLLTAAALLIAIYDAKQWGNTPA